MTTRLAELMKQAEALSPEERYTLLAHLANRPRNGRDPDGAGGSHWSELRGSAPGLVGTDAQAWVSASRQEDQARIERGSL